MENFDVPYVDETVHGKAGWLHIKRAKLERGFQPDLLHVAMQEYGMPFRHDFYNDSRNFAGIGWSDMQVHNDGRRSNAAVDLLLPTLEKTRSNGWNNLQVLTDKLVASVLFDGLRAVGVEVVDAPRAYKADAAHRSSVQSASRVTVTAKKEVILCGGAINSPQLLMLSGIGPKDHLNQHGIAVIKDLPGVGQHLQDHVEVGLVFHMKNLPDKLWRWQSTFLAEAGPQYAANADPSSFTENHIPLIMDWFSGFDTPDPMHPDLHIHVFNAFFRDFNFNPQRWADPDPLKASYLDAVSHPDRRDDAQGLRDVPDRVREASSHGWPDHALERRPNRTADRGYGSARGGCRSDAPCDGDRAATKRDGASDPPTIRGGRSAAGTVVRDT